jgi:Right handed beta helix region
MRAMEVLAGYGWVLGALLALPGCGAATGADADQVVSEAVGESAQALAQLSDHYLDCPTAALQAGFETLYVAPNGNDSNAGTAAAPLASLNGANAKLPATLTKDYRIIVRGGTYRQHWAVWTKSSPSQRIHIEAAAGETPIFDGRAAGASLTVMPVALHLLTPDTVANITVRGLTIQNYGQMGIMLRGACNRIFDNEIKDIGNLAADCKQVPLPAPNQSQLGWVFKRPECTEWAGDGCKCEGYGAIDMPGASRTVVKHNDIINSINGSQFGSKAGLMHAMYVAYQSQQNLLEDNYVRGVSGNPVKFRDGSSNNVAKNNYLERAGNGNFFVDGPSSGEPASVNNELVGNVATFSTTGATNVLVNKASSFVITGDQGTGKLFQGMTSTDEHVAASVAADIDGDGKQEVFVALNYPTLGFTKIVYSDGGSSQLRTVSYSSNLWQVKALAAGDFTGAGTQKVVAVFYRAATDKTQIAVGGLVDGAYRFSAATTLADMTGWDVSAITAGKFGTDATDKLITAVTTGGLQKIFRGDGATAASGSSIPGVDNGSPLYSNSNWRVQALTNCKLNGSTNQLISGFRWIGSGAALNRIYTADGVTGGASTSIFSDASKVVTALSCGKLGGASVQLAIGFDVGGVGTVYTSNGIGSLLSKKVYENSFWDITSLAAAQVDSDTNDELITAFDMAAKTEVHAGDATTLGSGATNVGVFYKNPE